MKKGPQEVVVADSPRGVGVKIRAEVEELLLRQFDAEIAQHLQGNDRKS